MRITTNHLNLDVIGSLKLDLHQMDVRVILLYCDVKEDIYMEYTGCFGQKNHRNLVCDLRLNNSSI